MASRYVPPHLRNKPKDGENETRMDQRKTSGESLAQRRLSDLNISGDHGRALRTLHEVNHHYGSTLVHSTLRDTSEKPGRLGFVVLFRGANPRWNTDHIIYAHTNIHLLPGYASFHEQVRDEKPPLNDVTNGTAEVSLADAMIDNRVPESSAELKGGISLEQSASASHKGSVARVDQTQPINKNDENTPSEPVPIFMESSSRRGSRKLAFHGYFHLVQVDFLKPHSPELVRMLQQKWEPVRRNSNVPPARTKQRDPAAWAKSLSQEWAVVRMSPVPRNEAEEDPQIAILPEEEQQSFTGDLQAQASLPND